jgi:hypothetical protein
MCRGAGKWANSKTPRLVSSVQLQGHEVCEIVTSHTAEHAVALVHGFTGEFQNA